MSYEKQYFSDGEIITASQLNHIENGIVAAGNVRNFLDNSNFLNPVNQRGSTSYTGNIYTIDRWALWNLDDTPTLTINAGSISMTQCLYQNILGADPDKTYTFAVMMESGVRVLSGVPELGADDGVLRLLVSVGGYVQVAIMGSHTLYWAALYEGEYTVDTLPAYQPKGYAAELAECQRYFERKYLHIYGNGFPYMYYSVAYSRKRALPTINIITDAHSNNTTVVAERWAVTYTNSGGLMCNVTSSGIDAEYWYGYFEISADL